MGGFGVFFTTEVELWSTFRSPMPQTLHQGPFWEPRDGDSVMEGEIVDLWGRHITKMMIMGACTRTAKMGCFGVFFKKEVEFSGSLWSLQASESPFRSILRAKRRRFSFGGRNGWSVGPTHHKNDDNTAIQKKKSINGQFWGIFHHKGWIMNYFSVPPCLGLYI